MTLTKKNKHRYVMLTALFAILLGCIGLHFYQTQNVQQYTDINKPHVFTPDWGIAATLMSMQHPPLAVGDKQGYAFRVNSPELPQEVIDVGYRGQPNAELLAELQPDVIINTINYKENTAAYPANIPLVFTDFGNLNLALDETPDWERFTPYIHDIAGAINQPEIGDAYIEQSRQRIIDAGENIRRHLSDDRKLLVSNFWDMRQMSVFNLNSNISTTVQMMGLEFLSIGEPTKWGSSYIYPDKLYDLPEDTCLIIIEPVLEFTKYDNVRSPIWQRSPFFAPDACLYVIDAVWTNNGIESMVTFANNLEAAVTGSEGNDISFGAVYPHDDNQGEAQGNVNQGNFYQEGEHQLEVNNNDK